MVYSVARLHILYCKLKNASVSSVVLLDHCLSLLVPTKDKMCVIVTNEIVSSVSYAQQCMVFSSAAPFLFISGLPVRTDVCDEL